MRFGILLLTGLTLGACTAPDAAGGGTAVLASAGPADPNQLVCRYEQVTGQHRRERICMTAARREALREATQEGLVSRGAERPNAAQEKGGGLGGPQ